MTPLPHCTAPTTLHRSIPLHCTHYSLPSLFHCTSSHPHYSPARCSALHRTSSALHAIALYYCAVFHCASSAQHFTAPYTLHCISVRFIARCNALHALHFTARCSALHYTAPHNNVLQCTTLSSFAWKLGEQMHLHYNHDNSQ